MCPHREKPSLRFPKLKAERGGELNRITAWWRGVDWHGLLEPKQGEGEADKWIFQGNRLNRRETEREREIYYMIIEAEKSRIYSQQAGDLES